MSKLRQAIGADPWVNRLFAVLCVIALAGNAVAALFPGLAASPVPAGIRFAVSAAFILVLIAKCIFVVVRLARPNRTETTSRH